MAASYPSSIITLPTINNGDTSDASNINTPNAEIVAIETGLLNGFQHDLKPLNDDSNSIGSTSKRWLKGWFQDLDLDGTLTLAAGLPVASGGTGLTSGTSGGILAFTGGTTLASSAALAANALALGGGAGAVPFTDSNWTIEQTAHTLSSATQSRVVAFHSTTQSIADATMTAVSLDSEDVDVGGLHSTSSNTSRLTIPTGAGGFYLVFGQVSFAVNVTGVRTARITKNGATDLALTQFNAVSDGIRPTVIPVTWSGTLAAADYVEMFAQQTSGGALNVGSATRSAANAFTAVKLW